MRFLLLLVENFLFFSVVVENDSFDQLTTVSERLINEPVERLRDALLSS